ncbi:hypothetical protein [Candidatus Electronema sp. TJ]
MAVADSSTAAPPALQALRRMKRCSWKRAVVSFFIAEKPEKLIGGQSI